MIPKFFHTRLEMILEELSEWNGMTLIPEDARIKEMKEFWLEFEVLVYLDNLLNNYNSFWTNFSRNFRV